MKLGIVLPNQVPVGLDGRRVLDWARTADAAGFYGLATIDKPNYDGWDPLATLTAAASVTRSARLATTILQLPNRNAVQVAEQAAIVDVLSNGRLDLGVAVGGRKDDYEVYGVSERFHDRGRRFPDQVRTIRAFWDRARTSTPEHGEPGPAPVQDPPPICVGGMTEQTIERAIQIGDGFMFGTRGAAGMGELTPSIRERAAAIGKQNFPVIGLAYCAAGEGDDVLDRGAAAIVRYYGRLWAPPEQMILHGPAARILEGVKAYEGTGIDALYLWPQLNDLSQVEMLAEGVLPAFS